MEIVDARVRLPHELRTEPTAPANPLAHEQYDRILDLDNKTRAGTLATLLASMDTAGVAAAVLHAETEVAADAGPLDEAVAAVMANHPGRFAGVGTIDLPPSTPGRAARQVSDISALGLVGVSVEPAFFGMDIDDRWFYPAYARAEELGLVVNVHTGINYARSAPMRHEHAFLLDQVACDFPDLRLVACHGGWPQVAEYCAVARRHPTVFLEFGGLAPKYLGRPGSGWEVLMSFLPRVLTEQVLFGTDWPVMDHPRVLAEWRGLGLTDGVLARLFGTNARQLYWN